MARTAVKQRKTKGKKLVKKRKRRRRLISALRLKRLAYAHDDMSEADHAAALRRSLAALIERDEVLAEAWARGQFLRNLEKAACTLASLSKAAGYLKIAGGGVELRRILDADEEARDVWEQNFLRTDMETRQAIVDAAKEGNSQAIKTVEVLLRDQERSSSGGASDFKRIPMNQMAELFAVSRQAVYEWYTKKGLERNTDGTFNLIAAIQWFERYVEARSAAGGKGVEIDPMRSAKTRMIEVELQRQLGKLLDRDAVVAGQVARLQVLTRSLQALARDVAPMLENQPLLRIREILDAEVRSILAEQKKIPEELELPQGAAAALSECYEQLG